MENIIDYEEFLNEHSIDLNHCCFVQTCNNFIRNENIELTDKMVFICLQGYAGERDSCFPSKATIAKNLKISEKTVYTSLKRLEDIGAIVSIRQIRQSGAKTSNLYILAKINWETGEFEKDSIKNYLKDKNITFRVK